MRRLPTYVTRRRFLTAGIQGATILALAACLPGNDREASRPQEESKQPLPATCSELDARGLYPEVRFTDGQRHLIPLDQIEWGGVGRDAIPAIDRPHYVAQDRFDHMVYGPSRLVIGVEVNGKRRAYPLQVLIWHEIVNEVFDGKHLLVTY